MSEIKVRNDHPDADGRTLGLVLEDGDIYPVTIPKNGHVPTEIDGRKVSKQFRDGLLEQDGWSKVRPPAAKKAAASKVRSPAAKKAAASDAAADSAGDASADNANSPDAGKDGE